MSLSGDKENDRKNCIKRQSVDSPLAVLSPSVRPQSTKLSRLSETPLRPKLANINKVDPNIDATFLELCSVERDEVPAVIILDQNIEQCLVDESIIPVETAKEALAERSIASECDSNVTITDKTSSSIAAAISPGMSDEMKSAIKTYLKSASICVTSSLESETELLNMVDNVADVRKNEDTAELNISISTCGSQEKPMENNSTNSENEKVDLSVEFSTGTTEVNSCSEITCEIVDTSDVVKASFTEVSSTPIIQFENAKTIYANTPNYLEAEVDEMIRSPNMKENLTLSVRKNKVLATRNLNLDSLSSPRELASYAEERAQNYSFLINEAYCETSVFCENCYAMRIELELFSEKFAALTATIGGTTAEKNAAFVAEFENLLKEKQAEIVTLSSNLKDSVETNEQLSRQKEIAEKDAEDYRFLFKDEMKKKLEEIDILRRKLYEAEDLIEELTQAKPKHESKKKTAQAGIEFETSLVEGCQIEAEIENIQRQLDTAHSLHQKAQKTVEELECKLQKVEEENNQLSLKLQKALTDLEDEKSNRMMIAESKHVSIISLLEDKVAELGNKIDEALKAKDDETAKQKSFLFEKLTSLLEKIRSDVKSNVFTSKWEADDLEISVKYFEKAVNIICQDIPQFEILVEAVAQHGKLAKNEFKQLEAMMEEVVEKNKNQEIVSANEKLPYNSLQEVMLAQFCENRNYFSSLLEDFRKDWADTLHSIAKLPEMETEQNRDCAVLEMLHSIKDLQEKSNEKYLKDSNELQRCTACLEKQHLLVTSFQEEIREMNNKIKVLLESVEKDFKNSGALMDGLRNAETKQKIRVDYIKNQLRHQESEANVFKEISAEEVIQNSSVEQLQKIEESAESQNTVMCKNLDFERENSSPIIQIAEDLTEEKIKLEHENVTLRSTIFKLESENTDLKKIGEEWSLQCKKVEELEHALNLLQKENERLEKACDDADDEVGDLKEQIFELLRANAELQSIIHGEGEEAVNRRMGYIEAPGIQREIHLSAQETMSLLKSPDVKPADLTGNSLNSKMNMKAVGELTENTEVEKKEEAQKLEREKKVLLEATNILTKKMASEESPKSKKTRDQSCLTS